MLRCHFLFIFMFAAALLGCSSYVGSTPVKGSAGDNVANYRSAFGSEIPPGLDVINSVATRHQYASSLSGATFNYTYTFELIAPPEWIESKTKHLQKADGSLGDEINLHRRNAPKWYAPKEPSRYNYYFDFTSASFIHMVAEKNPQPDGRYRVFLPGSLTFGP